MSHMVEELIACKTCETPFAESDSIGSNFGLCQDCWEHEADESWWQTCEAIQQALNGRSEEIQQQEDVDARRKERE